MSHKEMMFEQLNAEYEKQYEEVLNEIYDEFDVHVENIIKSLKKRIDVYFDNARNIDLTLRLNDVEDEEKLKENEIAEVKERMKEVLLSLVDELKEDLEEKIKI